EGARCVLAAVLVLPLKPEEQIARSELARIDNRAPGPPARPLRDHLRARRPSDAIRRELDHPLTAGRSSCGRGPPGLPRGRRTGSFAHPRTPGPARGP